MSLKGIKHKRRGVELSRGTVTLPSAAAGGMKQKLCFGGNGLSHPGNIVLLYFWIVPFPISDR